MRNRSSMQNFSRQLLTEWRKLELPFADKNIIVAVSGGADSCSLAFALNDLFKCNKLKNKYTIAHFNHKLREDNASDEDANYVKGLANKLGFGFITESAKTGEINKKSNVEQSARFARYDFLKRIALKTNSEIVLMAHTMNDQAETFLLNLIRGSGIGGLSAMKAVRTFDDRDNILLVRPLLSWAKREDVERFANKNKIEFRRDSMNDDKNFKRVMIRKDLIPKLKTFNPNVVETLANTSNILASEIALIEELFEAKSDTQKIINAEHLNISYLQNLSNTMLYKVLREWLLIRRGDLRSLEFIHLTAIKDLIHSRKSGRLVELPNFETVRKEKGNLIFQVVEVEK